jgi:hypothetical protein
MTAVLDKKAVGARPAGDHPFSGWHRRNRKAGDRPRGGLLQPANCRDGVDRARCANQRFYGDLREAVGLQ